MGKEEAIGLSDNAESERETETSKSMEKKTAIGGRKGEEPCRSNRRKKYFRGQLYHFGENLM